MDAGPLRLPIRHLMTVAAAQGPDDELVKLGIGPGGSVVELRGKLTRATPFVRETHLMSATILDSSGSRRIALEQIRPFWYLSVQPLATGGVVVVDSRAVPWENAVVFGRDGGVIAQFEVGNGIQDFLVDESDGLWVSYFDEGVYGGHPLSANGLCRFDNGGNLLWFNESAHISDCYALNLAGTTAWAHYFDAFDVMRVGADAVEVWRTGEVGSSLASIGAHGAHALLVDGERVVLIGSYGDPFVATCWSLGSDQLEAAQPVALDLPAELRDRPRVLRSRVCRGDRIYLTDGNDLYSGAMSEMS